MALRFKNADIRPVLAEAQSNQCSLLLVKDQGVYFMSERGERRPDKRRKLIAYAVGCNPDVDPFESWWDLGRDELGGDDFAETFSPKGRVFQHILNSNDDLKLSANPTTLYLEPIAPDSAD